MALPTNGTISIGSLRNFFGDTGSSSLSEFYRGSALVPSSASVAVSVPYTYYTTTTENQTQYQTQYETQYQTQYQNQQQTTYSTYGEYGWDNYSGAQTFWYGSASNTKYFIIWAGSYKRYLSSYFTSYAHADGWTYSLQSVMYVIGADIYIGDVYRTRQVATTTTVSVPVQVAVQVAVQVPVTVQVQVQNGPYTGYTTEYQNENRNTSVANSGTISLSTFYGASN